MPDKNLEERKVEALEAIASWLRTIGLVIAITGASIVISIVAK